MAVEEGITSSWQSNNTRLPVTIGDTLKIDAEVTPANATLKALSFSSANPEIATVDQDGNLTVKGYGDVTITVKSISGKTIDIPFSFYHQAFTDKDEIINGVNLILNRYLSEANASKSIGGDWWQGDTNKTYTTDNVTITCSTGLWTTPSAGSFSITRYKDDLAISQNLVPVYISTTTEGGLSIKAEAGSYLGDTKLETVGPGTIKVELPDNQGDVEIEYNEINLLSSDRNDNYTMKFEKDLPHNGITAGESYTITDLSKITRIAVNL